MCFSSGCIPRHNRGFCILSNSVLHSTEKTTSRNDVVFHFLLSATIVQRGLFLQAEDLPGRILFFIRCSQKCSGEDLHL